MLYFEELYATICTFVRLNKRRIEMAACGCKGAKVVKKAPVAKKPAAKKKAAAKKK